MRLRKATTAEASFFISVISTSKDEHLRNRSVSALEHLTGGAAEFRESALYEETGVIIEAFVPVGFASAPAREQVTPPQLPHHQHAQSYGMSSRHPHSTQRSQSGLG